MNDIHAAATEISKEVWIMNTITSISVAILFSASTAVINTALADDHELELEPCINGGVSASGLYVSQELEDSANKYATVNE